MSYQEYILIANVFFCSILTLFVGSRGIKHIANLGFSLGMGGLALKETSIAMIAFGPEGDIFLWEQIFLFSQAFMAGGWVIFSTTVARANTSELFRKWSPLIGLYYTALFAGLWASLFTMDAHFSSQGQSFTVSDTSFFLFLIYLPVMVFTLMNLEQTFRASSGTPRYRIKYMFLGTGIIVALEIYRSSQVLLYSAIDLGLLPFYSIALICSYSLILFTVVRHRLLKVDIFVSRYIIYKSVSLLAVGVYLSVVGLMVSGVQRFGDGRYIRLIPIVVFAALLGLVILLLSEGLRRKVQTFINVHFFRNKYDYRIKWQEFTATVSSKLTLTELLPSLVSWVSETIGTNDAAIWLLDQERNRYYLASRKSFPSAPATWSDKGALVEAMNENAAPLELVKSKGLYESIKQESPEFFDNHRDTAWIPMILNQKMLGILALGRKITDDQYDYHDLELLMTISDQAAGQIQRVRVIEKLAVVRELKAIHTLSSFFLHDLKNYTSTLSLLAQNVKSHGANPEFQKDAFCTIESTVDKMNQLIRHITVVAKGLVLSKSEVDISELLEGTLSGLNGALGLKGQIYSMMGDLPPISADPEQITNVFRNLIINACNAVDGKGDVNIETRAENEHIYVSFRDNGCGMSEEFISTKLFKPLRTTKAAGWGIGLFQCQQIMNAHGGRIAVESTEGEGSTFTVELPLVNK